MRRFFSTLVPIVMRAAVIAAPPLLLANVLLAAPKKATPPSKAPPKKPPAKMPKDAAADAEIDAAPKESKPPDAGSGASGELLKESEKKEGDAAVKVFEFGTTEIEGRARWPAVTYFVRRMRAEFEAQKLPHRPFLPELTGTKADPAVK